MFVFSLFVFSIYLFGFCIIASVYAPWLMITGTHLNIDISSLWNGNQLGTDFLFNDL